MKYQAVIFDLFGTLIPNWSIKQYDSVVSRIAATLGVDLGVLDNLIRLDWKGISLTGVFHPPCTRSSGTLGYLRTRLSLWENTG